jgi:hypothetical protein
MQACYDALSDTGSDDFHKKIKHGGWRRFYNKHVRSLVSIVNSSNFYDNELISFIH